MTRKARTAQTKPFSLSTFTKQPLKLSQTHLPKNNFNQSEKLFTRIQNPKSLIRLHPFFPCNPWLTFL